MSLQVGFSSCCMQLKCIYGGIRRPRLYLLITGYLANKSEFNELSNQVENFTIQLFDHDALLVALLVVSMVTSYFCTLNL